MGRVKETALFKKVEKNCGMSLEMHQEMEGCCHDELILKKVEDDQQLTTSKTAPDTKYFLLNEAIFNEMVMPIVSSIVEVEVQNTGPPDIKLPDLFILYHSLKIPSDLQS
ncbi:hypothetical protein BFP71_06205 [Roseivirga misakiensis]|uniref:Uncharacterized protein n=2 Tax=Roseivirga misakiensis TaxID=1563681 RepID=A0A1E5T2W8_9BACT|nr:hypothetical protein BFP71_06205 [Roseivirga misakiensis]